MSRTMEQSQLLTMLRQQYHAYLLITRLINLKLYGLGVKTLAPAA